MIDEIMDQYKKSCESFINRGGDESKFWAEKMSDIIHLLAESNIITLSNNFMLLLRVTDRYNIITKGGLK